MLIVLDNAQDAGQVRPLLPGSPGCLVLVTSRNRLTGLAAADGAHLVTLGALTEAESHDLLTQSLGAERAIAEPAAVSELIALCGRLPLAALVSEMRDERGRLDALERGEQATSVRMVFSWSRARLGDRAARMFRLLAGLPRGQAQLGWLRFLLGDGRLRALSGLSRAHVPQEQDRIPEAMVRARQALGLFRAAGDPRGEARALYDFTSARTGHDLWEIRAAVALLYFLKDVSSEVPVSSYPLSARIAY